LFIVLCSFERLKVQLRIVKSFFEKREKFFRNPKKAHQNKAIGAKIFAPPGKSLIRYAHFAFSQAGGAQNARR
jgi:hypothetical protein